MRENNTEILPIELTASHIHAINALNLNIHLSNAKHGVDSLVNAANIEQRLSIDDAVKQFCKNKLAIYNAWLKQLNDYAEFHGMSLQSAISVINDAGTIQLKALYWPSGFQNDAISKLEFESKELIKLVA